MSFNIALDGVVALEDGVWSASVPPDDISRFGEALCTRGQISVLLVEQPELRSGGTELRFPMASAAVLNAGTSERTFVVSAAVSYPSSTDAGRAPHHVTAELGSEIETPSARCSGDERFVETLREVPEGVRLAGIEFLKRVRRDCPGELKVYPRRRFYETPDNFWGVEIQVRKKMLKVTVRGIPQRFDFSKLELWLDRPPKYSGFKIRGLEDVDEALQIIRHAERK